MLRKVRSFVDRARYKDAVKFLEKMRTLDPDNVQILARLATLRHEEAFGGTDAQRSRAFRSAARDLRPLLGRMRSLAATERHQHRNEYYWFSGQYKKQHALGLEGLKLGDKSSYYSVGVGAANYAYELCKRGQKKRAMFWAQRAKFGWEKYFDEWRTDYHDPWAWYGLSLGILGFTSAAEVALAKSAKLARTSKNSPSLIRIRNMINEVQNLNR